VKATPKPKHWTQARLEDFVRSEGLSDRVRFHGTVAEAARYITAFDAFVLSSRSEGTPVTLLEAMAARVPIVATTVGGVPDVVSPKEAILVAPEDSGGMADAIRSVIADRKAAACRVESAITRLHVKFGMRRWIDAHESTYNAIISARTSV
jgi:glycosyltransferase involved in cell wall biosynthesis